MGFIRNLVLFPAVKEFWKSVEILKVTAISSVAPFTETRCIPFSHSPWMWLTNVRVSIDSIVYIFVQSMATILTINVNVKRKRTERELSRVSERVQRAIRHIIGPSGWDRR